MKVYRDLRSVTLEQPSHLTIGKFDGMHRGHQALLRDLIATARAEGCAAGALLFDPHPLKVLRPQAPLLTLSNLEERLALAKELGLDFAVVHPFTRETAQSSAREFMELSVKHLNLRALWAGPDFALGRNREGDLPTLRTLGEELGFRIRVIQPYRLRDLNGSDDQPVRSSHIRMLLEAGKVGEVAQLLGRNYSVPGRVIPGDGRGRTVGVPTANLAAPEDRQIPANGVYAVWVDWQGRRFMGACNVGVRPTVDGSRRTVEVHILDFDRDIYDQELVLHFVTRLRDEQRFPDLDALVTQIRQDVEEARYVLASFVGEAQPAGVPINNPCPVFEELAHTADWAIRAYGRDLRELFEHAAQAMYTLMEAPFDRAPELERQIHCQEADRELLLVTWLSELLYLTEVHGELYNRFHVHAIEDTRLTATVGGVQARSHMAHIKAVTYHDLKIEETAEGFAAVVVFDT